MADKGRARRTPPRSVAPEKLSNRLPKRRDPRRQQTEARIIEAFGRIVARDGLYEVRVNKLMREAGIGKKQLYQYFGDLSGVARAWSASGMQAPAAKRALAVRHPAPDSEMMQLTAMLRAFAENLRHNPTVLAAVHQQLGGPPELQSSFFDIRQTLLQRQVDFFLENPFIRAPDYVAVYSILYAAINYLALRARFAPSFNGMDLSKDDGWQALLGMVDTVGALAEVGIEQRRKSPARKKAAAPRGRKSKANGERSSARSTARR